MTSPEAASRIARALAATVLTVLAFVPQSPAARAQSADDTATERLEAVEAGALTRRELEPASVELGVLAEECLECSPELQARIWILIGIIESARLREQKATEAFRRAFTLDPAASLAERHVDRPATSSLFERVRTEVNAALDGTAAPMEARQPETAKTEADVRSRSRPKPKPRSPTAAPPPKPPKDEQIPMGNEPGTLECTPKARAVEVLRPIPIRCTKKAPDRPQPSRMEMAYRDADGDGKWRIVPMEPVGDAFQGTVPCPAMQRLGKLEVLVRGFDAAGQEVDFLGDAGTPMLFEIRQITGAPPPAYPGQPVPARCEAAEECPPGMPGCEAGEEAPHCEADEDCTPGVCEAGHCRPRVCYATEECVGGAVCVRRICRMKQPLKHVLNLAFGADFPLAGGQSVCRAREGGPKFGCFLPGSDEPYAGIAQLGNAGSTNQAFVFGTMRLLLGYEYLIDRHFRVGARVGVAFRGEPKFDKSRFLPFHAEVRGYYFPLADGRVRPFVMLGGGSATVDVRFGVRVADCGEPGTTEFDPICAASTDPQDPRKARSLDAVQRFGPGFVNAGAGAALRLGYHHGTHAELAYARFFPHPGGVLAPNIGYYYAF